MDYIQSINALAIESRLRSLWGAESAEELKEAVYSGTFPYELDEDLEADSADIPGTLYLVQKFTNKEPGTCRREGWNIKGIYSLFSLAFSLISKKTDSVIDALSSGNLSLIDSCFEISSVEGLCDSFRQHVIESHLTFLDQHHRAVKYWQFSRPVVQFCDVDMLSAAALQRSKPANIDEMNSLEYLDNMRGLFLWLDPCTPVDILCEQVKQIITEYQKDISQEHMMNWSDSEIDFYGEEAIKSMNPLNEFEYKRGSSEKRPGPIEDLFTTWGECLKIYQLSKNTKNNVIARMIYPAEFNSVSGDSKTASDKVRRRLKYAENLIDAALSNEPLILASRPSK